MDRKSIITFFAIYAVVAGIGYAAWADHDRGTAVGVPETVSISADGRAPERRVLGKPRLGGRARRLAGARHISKLQNSAEPEIEDHR